MDRCSPSGLLQRKASLVNGRTGKKWRDMEVFRRHSPSDTRVVTDWLMAYDFPIALFGSGRRVALVRTSKREIINRTDRRDILPRECLHEMPTGFNTVTVRKNGKRFAGLFVAAVVRLPWTADVIYLLIKVLVLCRTLFRSVIWRREERCGRRARRPNVGAILPGALMSSWR